MKRQHTLHEMGQQIQALRREFAALKSRRSAATALGLTRRCLEHDFLCRIETMAHSLAADAAARRDAYEKEHGAPL